MGEAPAWLPPSIVTSGPDPERPVNTLPCPVHRNVACLEELILSRSGPLCSGGRSALSSETGEGLASMG